MAIPTFLAARMRVLMLLAAALCALAPGLALAQFPDGKPVKIFVGFGPGTGSDLQARSLAEVLSRELGGAGAGGESSGRGGHVGCLGGGRSTARRAHARLRHHHVHGDDPAAEPQRQVRGAA